MLRPSRPMIRPFISSEGSVTLETVVEAACADAVRWMPIEMMLRTRRSASWRASSSIVRMRRATSWRACSSTRASSASRACAWVIAATRSSSRSCALDELRRARLALGERRVALGDAALARRDVGGELVELGRARAEPLLGARDLEAAALELLLGLAAGREHVLLGGDLRLLAHGVRLAAGGGELALGLRAQRLHRAAAAAQHDERERSPDCESHKGEYCGEHVGLPGPAGGCRAAPYSRASARHAGSRGGKAFRSLPVRSA